ncbi:hypothetical protein [Bacillus solitudinis]|uniref:hypothetical protein n=1 Tax=Bacillus solitudinis TaxID=2014074 RepID=UPI000C24E4AA|nr:hypothetical protein [Bacillus solitudinis]
MINIRTYLRSISFKGRFPFLQIYPKKRASLVLVKDNWNDCKTEAEFILYQQLRSGNLYPTPDYSVGGCHVNVALIPYRLALIEKQTLDEQKRISRALRKEKWRVLFYDVNHLTSDNLSYLQMVQQQTKQMKSRA